MPVTEVIYGFGHPNVLALHRGTVEFTKDSHLTLMGDCILVVGVDRGLAELGEEFKQALRRPNARLTIKIEADNVSEEVLAEGATHLPLSDPTEMVIRKSDYTSNRTLGVHANKAAKEISRELVEKLKNPTQKVIITLTVTTTKT